MLNIEIAYCFDDRGYYVGIETTELGTKRSGCTKIAPPSIATSTHIPKFNGREWELIENHIGESGFVNNKPFIVTEYGPYPDGWSDTYVPTKEDALDNQISSIKEEIRFLERKSLRPMRAKLAGTATDEDVEKLKELEKKLDVLRENLSNLTPSSID